MTNPLDIYEIFRACRLCGSGGGYKMPIIPSVIGIDDFADVELRRKIQECLQIEVSQDDKMPPLVCELCLDKVNDFYEFLEMCKATNKKTRQRLGLPVPLTTQNTTDDCILGVTESLCVPNDNEPPNRRVTRTGKGKKEEKPNPNSKNEHEEIMMLRRKLEVLMKKEANGQAKNDSASSSSSRRSSRARMSPSPSTKEQQKRNETRKPVPTKENDEQTIVILDDDEDDSPLMPRGKRLRGQPEEAEQVSAKRTRLASKLLPPEAAPKAAPKSRPGPKSSKASISSSPETAISRPGTRLTTRSISPQDAAKPRPGPKSSLRSTTPEESTLPKLRNSIQSMSPVVVVVRETRSTQNASKSFLGPKSKRSESPVNRPGPKSKRAASPLTRSRSVPKSTKRPDSPLSSYVTGPKSTKRPESPPSKSKPGPKSAKRSESPLINSKPGPKSTKRSESPPINSTPGPKSAMMSESPPSKSKPGPKSTKRSESPPINSKPGPKSAKRSESPPSKAKPGPKSAKRSESPPSRAKPGPKSVKRSESPPSKAKPGPKSAKRSESPPSKAKPGPKSAKRSESPPSKAKPGPKSAKRSESPPSKAKPGPKSAKMSESPPSKSRPVLKPTTRSESPRIKARPGPKPKRPVTPPPQLTDRQCNICQSQFQTKQGMKSHILHTHRVKTTAPDLACDPCGDWFVNADEAAAHHKYHKNKHIPYVCRACGAKYWQLKAYLQHMAEVPKPHVPWKEAPDVECPECWKEFPTLPLLDTHRCPGPDGRPGGKCSECNKYFHLQKSLEKHESGCLGKKQGSTVEDVRIDASMRKLLKRFEIRIVRCDALLRKGRKRYNISKLSSNFGVDPARKYPYRRVVRVKQEPLRCDGMVSINKEIQDEFYTAEDYVHWDSDNFTDSEEEYSLVDTTEIKKKIPSLTMLALKTIFSRRCMGKVPRKLRKGKSDKFDTFFNPEGDFDSVESDVNDIDKLDNGKTNHKDFNFNGVMSTHGVKPADKELVNNEVALPNIVNAKNDNDTISFNSESLLDNETKNAQNTEIIDFDSVMNSETFNEVLSKDRTEDSNIANGNESDDSVDTSAPITETAEAIIDENDTATENSQNLDHPPEDVTETAKEVMEENEMDVYDDTSALIAVTAKEIIDEKDTASENSQDLDHLPEDVTETAKEVMEENETDVPDDTSASIAVTAEEITEERDTVSEYSQDLDNPPTDVTEITKEVTERNETDVTDDTLGPIAVTAKEMMEERDIASEYSQDLDNPLAPITVNSKDTSLDNSQNFNNTDISDTVNMLNGSDTNIEGSLVNGVESTDLISEFIGLYDKNLMDDLDEQILVKDINLGSSVKERDVSITASLDVSITLEDLVADKDDRIIGLDAISDEEFNFDA